MLRDWGVTGIVATPSYALYLSEAMKEAGYPLSDYSLRLGILGSEPCTVSMREQIENNFNIRVSDNYGMTELGGPGVSGDCEARDGMHFAERACRYHPYAQRYARAQIPHQGYHKDQLSALLLRQNSRPYG